MTNNKLTNTVKHNPTTTAIMQNAVDAGKFDSDYASALLDLGSDPETVNTIRDLVKSTAINPKNLDGVSPAVLQLATKSYDNLGSGNLGLLKECAPEIYKAKFFEKNDRMPAERDGKPL